MINNKTSLKKRIFAFVGVVFVLVSVFVLSCSAFNVGYYPYTYTHIGGGLEMTAPPNTTYDGWDYFTESQRTENNIVSGWSAVTQFYPDEVVGSYINDPFDSLISPSIDLHTINFSLSLNNDFSIGSGDPVHVDDLALPLINLSGENNNYGANAILSVSSQNVMGGADIEMSLVYPSPVYLGYRTAFVGRLLCASWEDNIINLDLGSVGNDPTDTLVLKYDVLCRVMIDGEYYYLHFDRDTSLNGVSKIYNLTYGELLYNAIGDKIHDYRPADIDDHSYWVAYDEFINGIDISVDSELYSLLFSNCPDIYIDYVTVSPYVYNLNGSVHSWEELSSSFVGEGAFVGRRTLTYTFKTDCTTTSSLAVYFNNLNIGNNNSEPDWVRFTLNWLSDAVTGILAVEFVPYITFGTVVAIILAFSITMWWLKVYGGG